MIDWSKVSTPGAPPSGNPQTTTAPIPPATTSDLTQPPPSGGGWRDGLSGSTSSGGYQTGNGWRPASQAEADAMDPGQRIGRGIDYLGYLLFGNKSDQMGGEQYGHQAPLAGTGPVRDIVGLVGHGAHDLGTATVVKPIETGATVLSHVPLGWYPGGADGTFNEIGASLAANPQDPMSAELYQMWQQTKAQSDSDVLGGGNMKADFNDEVLRLLDDKQYDSSLGTTPTLYLGRRTVGSLGGAVSHAIEGWLGVASNQSQLLTGQSGLWDPYYSGHKAGEVGSTKIGYLLDAAANPDKYVMYAGSSTSLNLTTMNDFEQYAVTKVQSGEWSPDQAQGWVDKNINTKMSRIEEAAARSEVGMELSDVEQKAVEAYTTGAWSKQHAEEWIVSHGQGITRNPVGQIAGTIVTDPLTYATLGLGGISEVGAAGLRVAEAADVTIQSMKGLSVADRIAASTGNALRIAKAIPEAESTYQKIAMGIAAVQKSPAGPVARIGRGLIDPFGVFKPSMVDKTAIAIKNEVAVGALQRAHGPQTFSDLEAIGRETGMTTEIRTAAHNYAVDQADLMTSIEAQGQMLHKGMGLDMMDPNSELNNVDNVVGPMVENYGTKDAQTRLTDHIAERAKNTFTPAEEANLGHRLGTTLGGGIDWDARVAKMSHDLKSLLHAITYKLQETDWYKALNAVDKNAYKASGGTLPLHLGSLMDINSMDEEMAKQAVGDIETILADTARPDRIEAATKLWHDLSAAHDRMGNLGTAPGGEKQLQALLREMKSVIDHAGFPKTWSEDELSHPILHPLRDSLDRGSIPMTTEEVAAAKAAARKTATISRARKAAAEGRAAEQRAQLEEALAATQTKAGRAKPGMAQARKDAQQALDDFNIANPATTLPPAPAGTLYHGSPVAGMKTASSRTASKQFDNATSQFGAFATTSRDEAARYAGKGGTVYETAGMPSNPYHMPRKEFDYFQSPDKDALGNTLPSDQWAARAEELKAEAIAKRAELEAKGYDGVSVPGNRGNPDEVASFSDIALHPEGTAAAIADAEAAVSGVKRLWKVGSRPEETVAWGLKYDVNTGLPMRMREPTISHNFMAYPGKAPFSDTVRNALGQIIGTVPAEKVAKPIDSMEVFINTMQDVITGRRLVYNMQARFERTMFDVGVPKPLIRSIFGKAKDVAGLEKTTLRGLSAAEDGGLWKAIADDIPRDLRLANGQALDVHIVMDHLLQAAEGDLRVMGLTSKFSQRMRNAMRAANIDPVNYGGQMSVTAYNKMRYALNPTFIIQRLTDSIYYSVLYGIHPVGFGALSESNMALRAITDNLARTGTARDFAFDLPEFATRANWTAGVKSALQQAGINDNMLSKIANAPDALIQNNMVNMLHARLGHIVRGTLDNLAAAIEKDATLIAGATPEQAYILRRSFDDWASVYSKSAGRVLTDDEVGLIYVKDMLSGWRRAGPIDPLTGVMDFKGLMHEGAMMLPSDIGAMGSIMPDNLALELGYVGENAAAELRKDVMGSLQKVGGTYQHVLGEHDISWMKEALTNPMKLGAHPDYVKRALAYFSDTWDNYWYRLSLPVEKGGLDISAHYAKEAQQVIARLAQDRGMDPWEYMSGVMLINGGTDTLDTAVGRFINFLKKGEVSAEPSDWGAFFRSHLDPSAQTTLMDAYAKAQQVAAEAARAPKVGDKFIRTEADGRQFQWHVYTYDPKTGRVGITTNPKGVGRLGTMSREEWDALKNPGATAAATPADVPIQPPLGFTSNPHVVASGHSFPPDVPRDGLFHVTTGRDGVMREGFRGSNAGEAAAAIPNAPFTPGATPQETWDSVLQGMGLPGRKADGSLDSIEIPKVKTRVGPDGKWGFPDGYPADAPHTLAESASTFANAHELKLTTADGTPNEIATFRNEFGNTFGVPGSERPIQYVYRAISEEDYQGILKSGVMKSDGRMNLSMDEGTVASHRDPSWYLPGDLASDQPGEYAGRVVKIKVKEGDGWHIDGRDSYIKTSQEVPVDRIEMVSPKIVKTRTHTPSKHNSAERTYPDDVSVETTAITPDRQPLQGIGSVGDTLNKGRVSFVTSAVRAQAYHDRLQLAVKAARGEITNAEVADYFIPLYQKAYGEEFAQRMKDVLSDPNLLEGTTHTPQELVWMVKRLDDGLIGGSGGVSLGGMNTGLSAAEGAVHLTSKAEQLARIDPEQIATINLATREGAVANKGIDVGELTLPPEDLHPLSVVGDKPAVSQAQQVVDPLEQAKFDAAQQAYQAEQDKISKATVEHNHAMEQHTNDMLAYENDKINYRRDMQTYDRLTKQHARLQREYNAAEATNNAADAEHAAAMKQYKADQKVYEAEQKAYDDAVAASEDAMNSGDVPEPVQSTIDRWAGDARKKSKATTRLRSELEKLSDEGYDVAQADSLLDEFIDMERKSDTSMEEYGYEKDDAWKSIMDELESVAPIDKELPDEPFPPIKPEHPGYVDMPPKPIAPVKPEEPVAPVAPTRPPAPTLERPQPPKMMELKQEKPPEPTPVDPQEFWDKGIVDMLEKRSKTGPHPNPDVEGALQKVAEMTQRVLKDSKGAKNTRNTVRELGKAIPLTNPVPYNRTHVLIQHLIQTKIEDAQRDIFRLAEMQTQRTVLERSLNHPLFGLYPASYMWGKVLPESIKFLAKNPYAATYVINDVQRAIAVQREYDPEMEDKMNSIDRSAAAFWLDYMTPGLPWSDHSARMSPMFKDILKGDLVNILPDELSTMDPKRWYDQTLRTLQEIPGAVDTITGGDKQAASGPAWASGLNNITGASPAPGGEGGAATPGQISGAVQAAALAPILADDLSRLQDILLAGAPAGQRTPPLQCVAEGSNLSA